MTTCCKILLFCCSKQFDHVIMMCFILNMNSVMKNMSIMDPFEEHSKDMYRLIMSMTVYEEF